MCVTDPWRGMVLLGTERFGRYKGKQNLCSGHLEPCDGGCSLEAARRELCEEFKIDMPMREFELRVRCLMCVGSTPVFLLRMASNDVALLHMLNARIASDLHDESLPGTFKEVQHLEWVPYERIIENGKGLSSFVKYVIRKCAQRLFVPHKRPTRPTSPALVPSAVPS